MDIDLRTAHEKQRDEKHRRICEDFLTVSKKIPGARPYRVFSVLAEKYKMTQQGILQICKRNGLYKVNK